MSPHRGEGEDASLLELIAGSNHSSSREVTTSRDVNYCSSTSEDDGTDDSGTVCIPRPLKRAGHRTRCTAFLLLAAGAAIALAATAGREARTMREAHNPCSVGEARAETGCQATMLVERSHDGGEALAPELRAEASPAPLREEEAPPMVFHHMGWREEAARRYFGQPGGTAQELEATTTAGVIRTSAWATFPVERPPRRNAMIWPSTTVFPTAPSSGTSSTPRMPFRTTSGDRYFEMEGPETAATTTLASKSDARPVTVEGWTRVSDTSEFEKIAEPDLLPTRSSTSTTSRTATSSAPTSTSTSISTFTNTTTISTETLTSTQTTTHTVTHQAGYWEVVVNGTVDVKSHRDINSTTLDRKSKCDILHGKQEGEWVELLHEPGYIPIRTGSEIALKNIPWYVKLTSGSCSDSGLYPITDQRACEFAARKLGLAAARAEIQVATPAPEGCYWDKIAAQNHGAALWLATNPANEGLGANSVAQPLCSSWRAAAQEPLFHTCIPLPTTTTSTTTSTMTTSTSSTSTSTTSTSTVTTSSTSTRTSSTSTSSTKTFVTRPWQSPSLFCFSVMRETGYEPKLMRAQFVRNAGIFGCDERAIFCSADFTLRAAFHGAEHAVRFVPAAVGVSQDGTAGNAQLFMNIWEAVQKDGRFNWFDFTIKVDPDAVLLPRRLRAHLRPHVHDRVGFYVKNCNKYPGAPNFPMMYGSVEVFSRLALQLYFSGGLHCRQILPWQAWGEDFFMNKCLDMLGVSGVSDFDEVGDKRCLGADCSDGKSAAYHDFKSIDEWVDCWKNATHH